MNKENTNTNINEKTGNTDLALNEHEKAEKFVNSLNINFNSTPIFSAPKRERKSYSIVVKHANKKRKQCIAGTSDPELIIDKLLERVHVLQDEIAEIYKPGVLSTVVGTKFKLRRAEEDLEEARKQGFYDDEIEFKEAVVMARRIQEAQQTAILNNKIQNEEKNTN